MFSGSIGSAKSICAAHIIARHLIENDGARCLILRRALKDLKRTLWPTLLAHLSDIPHVISSYNKSEMKITLVNGSECIGDSYDKGDLEKFRSLELSMAAFEEASESNKDVYDAVKMRIGRLPHCQENLMLTLTNPDEPSHYLYKELIERDGEGNRKVFYSLTEDNRFLPTWYIDNLKQDLTPQMAKRMLQGQWLSIQGDTPYYAYDTNKQYLKDREYKINANYAVDIGHDFNIGESKPMSCMVAQCINGTFYVARDFVVEGFNTAQIVDEVIDSKIIPDNIRHIRVFGDRNGLNKDSRGNATDYEIIIKKLTQAYPMARVEKCVPRANPAIRSRQNIVNAHCLNDNGDIRLYLYRDAKVLDEGLRLTKVKKGSSYQEDDSDYFQHVVTALGYYIYYYKKVVAKRGLFKPRSGSR
jgi:PBSX family phage terminase large subunit